MAFSFLTPTNVFKRYETAKRYNDELTKPFPEFERIARNRPYEGIDPAYPKTTDGTAASIVQKTPKRVVQQLPTGIVECDYGEDWLCDIAQFIYTNKILPYANEDYGLFEKSHLAIEGGMTFGSATSYTPFLNHDGYFCPDMTLPYWGDMFLQKGKKSGYACNYVFMRSWWQKADIQSLIDSEKKLAKSKDYTPTWDVSELEEILNYRTSKDSQALTPGEEERGANTEALELVTGFQKGVGAKFYTFHPQSKKICRTKPNKDPRGKMPIDWFYGDIDGNNPWGRGVIELIGGLQNMIDSQMQMHEFNRALALAPPVVKYGQIGDFSFTPNSVIDAQNDPNAKIVPLVIDTTAIAEYPALYGLHKSQLLNLVNSPDTSISADVGNPGFSKTPAGINQQQAVISVDDNAIRKRFESWFENWSETAINLYFAERSGVDKLMLDEQTADKLRKLAQKGKFDIELLSENNEVILDYDSDTPILKFRVDASTTKMKDDAESTQNLIGLLETLEKNPVLQSVVPPEKIVGIWNSIIANSSVEDPEDLSIDVEQFKEQSQQQAQQTQGPPQKTPAESITFKDTVAAGALPAAAEMLRQAGLPSEGLNSPTQAELAQKQQQLDQSAQQQDHSQTLDVAKQIQAVQSQGHSQSMAEQQQKQQAQQPQATGKSQPAGKPQPQQPSPQHNPLDIQLAGQLKQLGLSDGAISQAIDMLDNGATEQQVLQAIGAQ